MARVLVLSILVGILFVETGFSQMDTIKLRNPSFEGIPSEGGRMLNADLPYGWNDCGFPGESPPDIHPVPNGVFNVTKAASHGRTYIGMVTRDIETWEIISQRLEKNLEKGKCYSFSIDLAKSELYSSFSKLNDNEPEEYIKPIKLRIYGGRTRICDKTELLAETSLVRHSRWLSYSFRFEPSENYPYLIFEAFYNTPTLYPYNGNILMDNASHIVRVPCDGEEPPIATVEEPKPAEKTQPQQKKPAIVNVAPTPRASSKPKILKSLDIEKIRKGQTIRIDKLFFEANSSDIPYASHPVLNEIFQFMQINSNVVIEIGGHTNTIPAHDFCDRLSTDRAKSVAFYLRDKGIAGRRLLYKGYGKRKPLTKDTSQEGRKENQRVEIKILSVNG